MSVVVLNKADERLRVATSGMPVREFRDLVDRRGDEPDAWPAHQRGRALILLEKSAEARAILAEARRVRELARASTIKAPPGLADRIVDIALNGKARESEKSKPSRAKRTAARTPRTR
jgi:hypothetical protein